MRCSRWHSCRWSRAVDRRHQPAAPVRRFAARGESPAVVALTPDGVEHGYGYAELADQATRIAAGPRWVAACFGVLCAGAVAVLLDAARRGPALGDPVHDADCRAVFADGERLKDLAQYGLASTIHLFTLDDAGDDRTAKPWRDLLAVPPGPLPEPAEDDTAALF